PLSVEDLLFTLTNPYLSSCSQTLPPPGSALVPYTTLFRSAGTVTVAATVGGTAITGSPATATFIAGAVDHTQSELVVTKDNEVENGRASCRVSATIVDANDNPIAGEDVVFTITNPDGTTSTQTVVTGADGTAAAEVTSSTAGTVTVAATVGGTAITGSPATATFVAGAVDHTQSELVVTKDNAVADGTDKNIFTATIVDANDNPIAGEDVVFTITNPDGTTS